MNVFSFPYWIPGFPLESSPIEGVLFTEHMPLPQSVQGYRVMERRFKVHSDIGAGQLQPGLPLQRNGASLLGVMHGD